MKTVLLATGLMILGTVGCSHDAMHDKDGMHDKMGHEHTGEHDDADETMVQFSDVPAAAQQALTRENGGTAPADVEKESKHGHTAYEIHTSMMGHDYEVKVMADGTLLSKKLEDDGDHDKPMKH